MCLAIEFYFDSFGNACLAVAISFILSIFVMLFLCGLINKHRLWEYSMLIMMTTTVCPALLCVCLLLKFCPAYIKLDISVFNCVIIFIPELGVICSRCLSCKQSIIKVP